jgi:hypothetical protein
MLYSYILKNDKIMGMSVKIAKTDITGFSGHNFATCNFARQNCLKATGNRQQATGNRQQATGNRQQATGNRQQAIILTI